MATPSTEKFGLRDVGPASRQLLTRADDIFDDQLHLTLADKLIRGQVPQASCRDAADYSQTAKLRRWPEPRPAGRVSRPDPNIGSGLV